MPFLLFLSARVPALAPAYECCTSKCGKKSRNTQRNEGFGAPKGVAAAAFRTGTQIEGGDSSGWKMASAGLGGPQFPPTKSSNFEPTPAEYT